MIAGLLSSGAALAVPQGTGRITFLPGWKLTPNTLFESYAAAAGHPLRASPGGPAANVAFAYAATPEIEIEISAFGSLDQLHLSGLPVLQSITYGAMIGGRASLPLFDDRLRPSVFAGTGVMLALTNGGGMTGLQEKLNNGWVIGLGLAVALNDDFDFNIDYKLMLGVRGALTGVGSVNGGGSWFSIGFSYLFPSEASHAPKSSVPNMENFEMQSPALPGGHDL